jgi:hypothetical protein
VPGERETINPVPYMQIHQINQNGHFGTGSNQVKGLTYLPKLKLYLPIFIRRREKPNMFGTAISSQSFFLKAAHHSL